jgi:hypothetical protein
MSYFAMYPSTRSCFLLVPILTLASIQLLHGGQAFRREVVSTRDVLRPLVGLAILNVF